jgi:ATP phosphoribosyltransferase
MTVVLVRGRDVPRVVGMGFADIGLTGIDMVRESGEDVRVLANLPFRLSCVVLAKRNSQEGRHNARNAKTSRENAAIVVVSEYPQLTKRYFDKKGKQVHVIPVHGAAEAYTSFPQVDYIVTLRTSGSSLRANGLYVVDTILKTYPCIVAPGGKKTLGPWVRDFVGRLVSAAKVK